MRILQLTEAASAGVGRHVIDLVAGLNALGCQSHVVYSTGRMDEVFDRRLRELAVPRAVIEMRRSPHWSDLRAIAALRAYVRRHGPFDIIHAHSTKAGLVARLTPTRGAKIVYTPHCIYTMNPTAGKLAALAASALERGLAPRSARIVAVSPDEKEHIQSLGIAPRRLACIVNGVDAPERVEQRLARERLGLSADGIWIGFLGRLSRQKDPLTLLRAVAPVLAKHAEAHVAIAGAGELESAGMDLARQLNVAQRVRWLGFQTANVFMPSLDLFAMTSQYEGMPYTLLEAASWGLPMVTTDVGGARLAVEDGRNGYVTPVADVARLTERLDQLVADAALRARFAAESLRRSSQFSIRRMVEQTLELYSEVARGASPLARADDSRRREAARRSLERASATELASAGELTSADDLPATFGGAHSAEFAERGDRIPAG